MQKWYSCSYSINVYLERKQWLCNFKFLSNFCRHKVKSVLQIYINIFSLTSSTCLISLRRTIWLGLDTLLTCLITIARHLRLLSHIFRMLPSLSFFKYQTHTHRLLELYKLHIHIKQILILYMTRYVGLNRNFSYNGKW